MRSCLNCRNSHHRLELHVLRFKPSEAVSRYLADGNHFIFEMLAYEGNHDPRLVSMDSDSIPSATSKAESVGGQSAVASIVHLTKLIGALP